MTETKPVSPLPEGFTVGKPMGNHDGIRSYPAIKENSNEKYVVKLISIPESQVQLEALLLTGAYKDPAEATEYFKDVAENITREAELLQTLSKLDGFLSYESWKIVPMENGKLGYQVSLLSPYRRSLERFLKKNPVTHLQAVNLGLDMCTALAICRRAGYLYVDLKPSNIFIAKGKGYRIGDLGFVELSSLKYTSLPGKYRSPYSPPEAHDDLNTLNETVDTYAVGMILYQIYNEGTLPGIPQPGEPIPSPANADYEIGEIILKAIAPDPEDRWKSPIELGKALVAYMQRNTVNNTPIIPPSGVIQPDQTPLLQEVPADLSAEEEPGIPAEEPAKTTEPAPAAEAQKNAEEQPVIAVSPDEDMENAKDGENANEMIDQETEDVTVFVPGSRITVTPAREKSPSPAAASGGQDITAQQTMKIQIPPKSIPKPAPVEMDKTIVFKAVDQVSQTPAAAEEDDDFDFNLDEFISDLNLEDITEDSPKPAQQEETPIRRRRDREKKSHAGLILGIIMAVLLVILGILGFSFYKNHYLYPIDSLTVTGSKDELTVTVDTEKDPSVLKVICTDTYGASVSQPLQNGQAVFTDLLPGSLYRIELEVEGFRKLMGKTSDIFTTDNTTNIVDISAIAGAEDGSVILNFTVDGAEPSEWTVTCTADGEEDVVKTFTGHSVTVKGLATGKLYSITLSAGEHVEITGENTLVHIPSKLILAENLRIAAMAGGSMTVRWETPANTVVESWMVRCYNNNGYEEIVEVTDTQVTFHELDATQAYTVEVTAAGMTQPERTDITANPITISNLTVDEEDPTSLTINWEHSGNAPEGGWLVLYSVDGQDNQQSIVKCDGASAVLSPRIHGATYKFTIQAADSTTVFNNVHTYTAPHAAVFNRHGLSAERITSVLLKTPSDPEWRFESVDPTVFTDTFTIGDKISVVLKANANYFIPEDTLTILYVFRDENGKVVLDCISEEIGDWKALWYDGNYRNGELNIPKVPSSAGKFTLDIYFDGFAVTSANFTIQE